MTRPEKHLHNLTVRVGKGHAGVRQTDPEKAQLEALCMALGLDKSGVIRLALDRLAQSLGPLTKPSDLPPVLEGESQ